MTTQCSSRRQFLTAAGALFTWGLTASEVKACRRRRRVCRAEPPCPSLIPWQPEPPPVPQLRVRQNVAAVSQQQLDSLRKGVAAMMARPASDPTSWRFQANIHGTLDPVTSPLFNQCQHGNLHFSTR